MNADQLRAQLDDQSIGIQKQRDLLSELHQAILTFSNLVSADAISGIVVAYIREGRAYSNEVAFDDELKRAIIQSQDRRINEIESLLGITEDAPNEH